MDKISIIIVSWNARGYLQDCLASIRETRGALVQEVIVVDNASSDGSPEMVVEKFPEVVLIRAGENLGFARANNLGLRRASGTWLALVNSDIVVHQGCLEKLADFLKNHSEVGLVGPKVFGPDGRVQMTCGRSPTIWNSFCEFFLLYRLFPRWKFFSGFQIPPEQHVRSAAVEVLSGCLWFARREAVEKVGDLDERFFFYAEDIDWCKRFREAGWKLMYVPEATVKHWGGGSSANAPLRYSIEILRANLTYWKKHHGNLGRAAYYLLVLAQHGIRLVVRSFLRAVGLANGEASKSKLREHIVCLRWLLTGVNV
jgi:GT2 family glycosyltransferase